MSTYEIKRDGGAYVVTCDGEEVALEFTRLDAEKEVEKRSQLNLFEQTEEDHE